MTVMSVFANTDRAMVVFFCTWLRRLFNVDETRFRVRVYLHEGLDLEAAESHWSLVTNVARVTVPSAVPCESGCYDTSERSTNSDACTSVTRAHAPTERSWASSAHCYPWEPFRGGSIGGAAAC